MINKAKSEKEIMLITYFKSTKQRSLHSVIYTEKTANTLFDVRYSNS